MAVIQSYLTFNGNCREAMSFYQQCLGGDLIFQTIGESPISDKMPLEMKPYILHSTLTHSKLFLMGSDMVGENGLQKGNTVSLMLECQSEEELQMAFKRLSEGGNIDHPLEESFWGALFGDITDKFGNHWLLNFSRNRGMN